MLKRTSVCILLFILTLFASCKNEPWVAKVDGEAFTLEEFENYYYANHISVYNKSREEIDKLASDSKEVSRNPYLNRKKFLEQLIRYELVMKKIENEGLLKDDHEFESILFLSNLSIVVNKYASLKFKDKLQITDAEVEAEYAANKEQYKEMQANQVQNLIKQKLEYTKYRELSDQLLEDLKSQHKIDRNEDLIKKVTEAEKNDPSLDDTLITIDGKEKFTVKDFYDYYYAQHKSIYDATNEDIDKIAINPAQLQQNPLLNKKTFLDQFISQKLVYNEALDGEFKLKDDVDLQYMMKMQEKVLTFGYYIKKKYSKDFEPTDAEIDTVYQQYKENFKGASAQQIEAYIRPQIMQAKSQQKMNELIETAQEESVIEYNNKVLNQKGEEEKK